MEDLTNNDIKSYDFVVGYGLGATYRRFGNLVRNKIKLDYLCDRNYESFPKILDGTPVISPEKLLELKNVLVVIFLELPRNREPVIKILENNKIAYIEVNKLAEIETVITGKLLRGDQSLAGIWKDNRENCVEFSDDINDNIIIRFMGEHSTVRIKERTSITQLYIECGNNGVVEIGNNTTIENNVHMYAAYARIIIGQACMLSYGSELRTYDGHHIFNKETGTRINYNKDIIVGEHVWIGHGATLVSGASIGSGSIVGAFSITSSCFPTACILAGNPAKIIREGVCWNRESDAVSNFNKLNECRIDKL